MIAHIHAETVVGKTSITTYRVEGSHAIFGDEYYTVYVDRSCVGEFKYKNWAGKFHAVVVTHIRHNSKAGVE